MEAHVSIVDTMLDKLLAVNEDGELIGNTLTFENSSVLKVNPNPEPGAEFILNRFVIEGRGRELKTIFSKDEIGPKFDALKRAVKKEAKKNGVALSIPSEFNLVRKGETANFGTFGVLSLKSPGVYSFVPGTKPEAEAGLNEAELKERRDYKVSNDQATHMILGEATRILRNIRRSLK